jgi:hypothetical protein
VDSAVAVVVLQVLALAVKAETALSIYIIDMLCLV